MITFNFINIAWIFFRAKEWDDAIKVLKGMFGVYGIVLPYIFKDKFPFFNNFNIKYGAFVANIEGSYDTPIVLLFGFIIVLLLKNTNNISSNSISRYKIFLVALFSSFVILKLNEISQFLYFNF